MRRSGRVVTGAKGRLEGVLIIGPEKEKKVAGVLIIGQKERRRRKRRYW